MTERSAEQTFIAQIRRGDQEAWREFIAQYEGRVTAFVRRRLGASSAVDDVVQETFVGFLLSVPNYDANRGLETYLFSIASHKLTDHLRRQGRRPTVPLVTVENTSRPGDDPADSARSVGSALASDERRGREAEALADALGEVIAHWRNKGDWHKTACVELLFVRGKPNKEAAALLGMTEQTVANIKFDFLARLRDAVRRLRLSPSDFPELSST
jgi:RNA polymerase sigma-70 factor (ECF subfamily)